MSGMPTIATVLALAAGMSAFTAGGCAMQVRMLCSIRKKRHAKALEGLVEGPKEQVAGKPRSFVLEYAAGLNTRLFAGQTTALALSVRKGRADKTRAGRAFLEMAVSSGMASRIGVAAFCESRTRLTAIGGVAGVLLGMVFSTEMGILLGGAAAIGACSLPMRAVRQAAAERSLDAQQHLSEMLEVVALGLRSGLTFDRSFALYGAHFHSGFAQACALAQRRWSLGLTTREAALRELAASYECDQLSRVVETIVRSLRFGSALMGSLSEAAVQARAAYRTSLAERVAKAPVKMMLPTGTLILPAMLLLVMGPILLELASGF